VPTMKPHCKAEVRLPTAVAGQPNANCKSGMTALTANHREVFDDNYLGRRVRIVDVNQSSLFCAASGPVILSSLTLQQPARCPAASARKITPPAPKPYTR
jgi:hypothetical protein